MQSDRISQIQQHLYARGFAHVQELAQATGASSVTIRRDLQRLEGEGLITRTSGGARLAGVVGPEVAFQLREQTRLGAKRAIAELAYRLLQPHGTVFLDAGTTVLQLARRLRLEPLPLTVFTNGLAVAQELLKVEEVTVNLLGGQLRDENLSLVGPYAERLLGEFWFDRLFLGTSAVRADAQLYTLHPAEASLNRAMIARTGQVTLLADSGKFGASAPYAVAPVTAANLLITDDHLEDGWKRRLAELAVSIRLAALGETA